MAIKPQTISVSSKDYDDLLKTSPFAALKKLLTDVGAYSAEVGVSYASGRESCHIRCEALQLSALLEKGEEKKWFTQSILSCTAEDREAASRLMMERIKNPILFIPPPDRHGWDISYCHVIIQADPPGLQVEKSRPILKLTP